MATNQKMRKTIIVFLVCLIITSLSYLIYMLWQPKNKIQNSNRSQKTQSLIPEKIYRLDQQNHTAISGTGKIYHLPNLKQTNLGYSDLQGKQVLLSKNKSSAIITEDELPYILDDGNDYEFNGSLSGQVGKNHWQSLDSHYVSPQFLGESERIIYLYRGDDWSIRSLSIADLDGQNWQNVFEFKDKKYSQGVVYPSPDDKKVIVGLVDENYQFSNFSINLESKTSKLIVIDGIITSVNWSFDSQTALLNSAIIGVNSDQALSPLYLYDLEDKSITKVMESKLTHRNGFGWVDQNEVLVAWNNDNSPISGNQTLVVVDISKNTQKIIATAKQSKFNLLRITYPQYLDAKIFFINNSDLNSLDYKL